MWGSWSLRADPGGLRERTSAVCTSYLTSIVGTLPDPNRLCLVTRFDIILCSPCPVNSNIDIRDRKNRVRAPKAKSNVFHCKKTDATIHLPGYRTAISEDLLKLLAEKRLGLFLRKVLCYKTVSTEPKGAGWKQLCNVIGR
jgi:hypothetical protein